MKLGICIWVWILWSCTWVQAQRAPIIWGKISEEEISFDQDQLSSPAGAVILCDYGIWQMAGNEERMALRRHIRIKILDSTGMAYARQQIYFQTVDELEEIKDLEAQTLNFENGKKSRTKLSLKYLPPQPQPEGQAMLDFIFRDARPGSILEYRYTLLTLDGYSLPPWYFQHEIPILHSELRMLGLADLYRPVAFGAKAPRQKWENDYIKRWFLSNLDAWQAVPFTASPSEGRVGLHLQYDPPRESYGITGFEDDWKSRLDQVRWEALSLRLEEITPFRAAPEKAQAFGSLVAGLTRDALTEEEKMARIYAHVRDHMHWNQQRDLFVTRTADEIYRSREAHATEINLLLTVLLQTAGLNAHKCFVSTRDHGRIQLNFPLLAQFNQLISYVRIGRQGFFLDATEPLRPYDLPSYASINAAGWVLERDTAYWKALPTGFVSRHAVQTLLDMNAPDSLIQITESFSNHAALHKRIAWREKEASLFWKEHAKSLDQAIPVDARLLDGEQAGGDLKLMYKLDSKSFIQNQGDTLLLYPLLAFGQQENPFGSGPRQLPIDFGTHQAMEYRLDIIPPAGYRLDSLPKGQRSLFPKDPLQLTYQIFQTPTGTLQVKLSWMIRRAVFLPSEKGDLFTFFNRLMQIRQLPIRWIKI